MMVNEVGQKEAAEGIDGDNEDGRDHTRLVGQVGEQ